MNLAFLNTVHIAYLDFKLSIQANDTCNPVVSRLIDISQSSDRYDTHSPIYRLIISTRHRNVITMRVIALYNPHQPRNQSP